MRLLIALCFLCSAASARDVWQLVWSDDFNGPANSAPDQSKWNYDIGNNGWGNQELENYTNSTQNSFLDGHGNLVIRAQQSSGAYTSARLKTQDRFTIQYGKIEARLKLPFGQGIWPAFWMLGADIPTAGWPASGEIDIMENIGREPAVNHGSMHGPGYSGGKSISAIYTLPNGQRLSDDFHTYAIIWKPGNVQFFVDSRLYETVTPAALPAGARWVFDHPFFLLLNVAVGGGWPGNPDASTTFPQTMTVDYVRVYRNGVGRHSA